MLRGFKNAEKRRKGQSGECGRHVRGYEIGLRESHFSRVMRPSLHNVVPLRCGIIGGAILVACGVCPLAPGRGSEGASVYLYASKCPLGI